MALLTIPATAQITPPGGVGPAPRFGLPGVTLLAPAPVAGCEAILTPTVIENLKTLAVDPAETWERWRQSKHIEIVQPFVVDCFHRQWQALHASPKGHAFTLDLESEPAAVVVPLAPTVGTNINMAVGVGNAGVSAYQGETSIAVNPSNASQLVAGANTQYADTACPPIPGNNNGTQALYGSVNNGASWTYNCAPWHSALTTQCPAGFFGGTANFGSDPAMVWDGAGNAYAVYMLASEGYDFTGAATCLYSAIVVAQSTNSGTTWTQWGNPVVNNFGNASLFDDKEMVAIDTSGGVYNARKYVIWDENNIERVAYSDTGTTWTTVVMTDPIGVTASCPANSYCHFGGNIVVGSNGTVYAVWERLHFQGGDYQDGEATVFAKSTNGGAAWSAASVVYTHRLFSFGCSGTTPPNCNNKPSPQNSRAVNAAPSIAIDNRTGQPTSGYLYVVFDDFPVGTTTGDNLDIWLTRSTDGGTTWSGIAKVNDNADTTTTQFFPWLAVDQSSGVLNISWLDTRNFATNNRRAQEFFTTSTDGLTFAANTQVHDNGGAPNFNNAVNYSDENTTDNTSYNPNQYGDYTGIAALSGTAHPMWTDTRSYYPTNPGGTSIEDAATAAVTNCTAPAAPGAPTLTPGCTNVSLSWTAVAGATDYEVWRSAGATCATPAQVVATTGGLTTYNNTGLTLNTQYSYFIKAKNACGTSGNGTCAATTTLAVPAAPTGVTATASAPNQITVSWGAVAGAATYTVYRSSGLCPGGVFSVLQSGVAGTSWQDSTVTGGLSYSYQVAAVNACGASAQSTCAGATAYGICSAPPTFSGLGSATVGGSGTCTVNLAWAAGSSNCGTSVKYSVYRSTTNGFAPAVGNRIATGVIGTSYTDVSGLAASTTYYYVVRAADTGNNIEETNTIQQSATLPATCVTGAPDVQAFTATSTGNSGATTGQNLLQWLNPAGGPTGLTVTINYRTDTYPVGPTDGVATTILSGRPVTLGAIDSFTHTVLTNGTTYYYALWVRN